MSSGPITSPSLTGSFSPSLGQTGLAQDGKLLAELQGRLELAHSDYLARRYEPVARLLDELIAAIPGYIQSNKSGSAQFELLLASAKCLRGRVFWRLGDPSAEQAAFVEAEKLFTANESEIAFHPYRSWLYSDYGIALFQVERMDDALRAFDRSADTGANPVDAFAFRGFIYLRRGELDLAEDAIRKALQLAPGDQDLTVALAETFARRENPDSIVVAQTYYEGALAALRNQEVEAARQALVKALAFAPAYPPALTVMFNGLRGGDADAAAEMERVLEAALAYDPGNAWAMSFKAVAQRDIGNLDGALEIFGSIKAVTPELAWVAVEHARTLLALGTEHNAEALERLGQARALDENNFDALMLEADIHSAADPDRALKLLRRSVELYPDVPSAHYTLAYQLFLTGDYEAAAASCDEVLRLERNFGAAYWLKAKILMQQGTQADEPARLLRKALQLLPDDAAVLGDLAEYLATGLAPDEAIAELGREISKKPDYWQAHWRLGQLLLWLRRFTEARTALGTAAELNPNAAAIQLDLAETLRLLDDYEEAGNAYDNALALEPDAAETLCGKIRWLCDTAAFVQAVLLAQQAMAVAPGLSEPYLLYGFAVMFVDGNAAESAEAAFRRAIEIDPKSQFGKMRLATLLFETGRLEQAVEAAAEFIASYSGSGEVGDLVPSLAWTYYLIGKYDEALRLLQSWSASVPDDLPSQFDRALSLLASKREIAGVEYQRIADLAEKMQPLIRRGILYVALHDVVKAAEAGRATELAIPVFALLRDRLQASGIDCAGLYWLGDHLEFAATA